jgi:Xaa-Pro dipeptidase
MSTPFTTRQSKLIAALQAAGLKAFVLNPGPSLTYLTGLHFHLSERPTALIMRADAPPIIILPELEAGKIAELPYPLQPFTFNDDPQSWSRTYQRAVQAAGLEGGKVGVEPRQLRVLELRLLEAAAPNIVFIPAEEITAGLRMCKDASEILAMRKAVAIAQQAFEATLPHLRIGITERELAAELTLQLLRHGSDPAMPFSPIVACGPNSANPHAFPTDRCIARGDLLVVDWGATSEGYLSDLTRTLAIGEPEPELAQIAEIVLEANVAARAKAAPGVSAAAVDAAAREIIERAGYGMFFTHRTGHGLGMEGHEEPYIRAGNSLILTPGMTFTIEPGIYLSGRGGVRIEDNMVVTEGGVESLSDLPRALCPLFR